jgi:hypothetical protein
MTPLLLTANEGSRDPTGFEKSDTAAHSRTPAAMRAVAYVPQVLLRNGADGATGTARVVVCSN